HETTGLAYAQIRGWRQVYTAAAWQGCPSSVTIASYSPSQCLVTALAARSCSAEQVAMETSPCRLPHQFASNFSRRLGSPGVPVQAQAVQEAGEGTDVLIPLALMSPSPSAMKNSSFQTLLAPLGFPARRTMQPISIDCI
ncbi:mCG145525, partial [Mus musculus]